MLTCPFIGQSASFSPCSQRGNFITSANQTEEESWTANGGLSQPEVRDLRTWNYSFHLVNSHQVFPNLKISIGGTILSLRWLLEGERLIILEFQARQGGLLSIHSSVPLF